MAPLGVVDIIFRALPVVVHALAAVALLRRSGRVGPPRALRMRILGGCMVVGGSCFVAFGLLVPPGDFVLPDWLIIVMSANGVIMIGTLVSYPVPRLSRPALLRIVLDIVVATAAVGFVLRVATSLWGPGTRHGRTTEGLVLGAVAIALWLVSRIRRAERRRGVHLAAALGCLIAGIVATTLVAEVAEVSADRVLTGSASLIALGLLAAASTATRVPTQSRVHVRVGLVLKQMPAVVAVAVMTGAMILDPGRLDRGYAVLAVMTAALVARHLLAAVDHVAEEERLGQLIAERTRELHDRATQLEVSRQRVAALLRAVPAGLGLISADWRVIEANDTLHDLLQLDERGRHGPVTLRADAAGSTVPRGALEMEFSGVGERAGRMLSATVSSFNSSEEDAQFVLLVQDITAKQQRSRQVETSQRLEAMGRLAGGIAHEINTPIQYVSDNVRFMADAVTDLIALVRRPAVGGAAATGDDAQLDFLQTEVPAAATQALDGIDRVATIVRALAFLSHPDASEQRREDLNAIVVKSVTVCNARLTPVADVVLDLADIESVMCYMSGLNQAVVNLLVNAADAIEEQDRQDRGTVTVTTRRDGDHAIISVADDGPGIHETVVDKIFEPFFTTKQSGAGTGQGLPLVHTVVVERHGGQIDVHTSAHGSAITLRIPVDGLPSTTTDSVAHAAPVL